MLLMQNTRYAVISWTRTGHIAFHNEEDKPVLFHHQNKSIFNALPMW